MDRRLRFFWAKTPVSEDSRWHPLVLHLLDVAASAQAVLEREPETTRCRIAACLGLAWEEARPWLLLAVACHDLGKASPAFQCKWPGAGELLCRAGVKVPPSPNTDVGHGLVSQLVLHELLAALGWPDELADHVADAVGCHHGNRASPIAIGYLSGDRRALGGTDWNEARRALFEGMRAVLAPGEAPVKQGLSGPDFMLIAGLTSFSDWIGSNEQSFSFGTVDDCADLCAWFQTRRAAAERALDEVGWQSRTPLLDAARSFQEVFAFAPRPLQKAVADAIAAVTAPSIILLEAPMGEGKTEAAFFAHLELQRRFGHRGMYVALPTKATGNAMFQRTLSFLRGRDLHRTLDLQLLHGGTLFNDTFQSLRTSGTGDSEEDGGVRAAEWFTSKKRALLSEYGVGTVDQALLPILPVRHNFVRIWGLANRVIVFDEVHAYDAYTGTLLIHLLAWLQALNASVVLLSATLPPDIRQKLAKLVHADFPSHEKQYPRISVFSPGSMRQAHFEPDPARRQEVRLVPIGTELAEVRSALDGALAGGGTGLALLNTVQRAQDLYALYPDGEILEREGQVVGKRLADGTEIFLFHARFPADRRQKREEESLAVFGGKGARCGKKVLIATQVAEQSLDLDFDVAVTDLAPIDLLLQRAGRLWRHKRGPRPVPVPVLFVAGLAGETPPSFGEPLWWDRVYREDLLLLTWLKLREEGRADLTLPDEIDPLVQEVYTERVGVPGNLAERYERAVMDGDGVALAKRGRANQAIIGFPDDASWNQPEKFVLYDEDEPGIHRTLMAQTRLGDDSVLAIPIWPGDGFDPAAAPDAVQSGCWHSRGMSLSRRGVVLRLRGLGVPETWQRSPLLRNCFPLLLDAEGRWLENPSVQLHDHLGLVYQAKEAP